MYNINIIFNVFINMQIFSHEIYVDLKNESIVY